MTVRFFNGLEIDAPAEWNDLSTVILAPQGVDGSKPSINLVVKRRPGSHAGDIARSVQDYLAFMRDAFGDLMGLETKQMVVGMAQGTVVRFAATADGKSFRQTTLLYHHDGEEISATITQVEGDNTSPELVDNLLRSVKPAGGSVRGKL